MKTLKFISAFIFIAICFSNVQSQLASWSDSQGGYSLNYMEIANDVPFSCDPTGPCFTNCPNFVVSTCDTIYLKFELSIFTVNTTSVTADFEIQFRPIGGSTNWLPLYDDVITGFCSIDKPQVNCCLKTYTYAIPMGNSYEYRIIIDPQWSSASGSVTFYNVDFYRPVVDLGFNLLNASSQTTNPTEPEIVCIDDDMILEVSPEFAQYLASFHNAYFGNDFILEIHKTDEDGIILDSEIIDDFNLDADYWTGSGFDLNELTDGWFEASGYYLIKLFDDGSSCYTDSDNYLWVELIEPVNDIEVAEFDPLNPTIPKFISLNSISTSLTSPLNGCIFQPSYRISAGNQTGEILDYDIEIDRYSLSGTYEATILSYLGFVGSRSIPNPSFQTVNLNSEIGTYGNFSDVIASNPYKIYHVKGKFLNECGEESFEFYFEAGNFCKTNFSNFLELDFSIYPNPAKNGYINIDIIENKPITINEIKIYDNLGRLVQSDAKYSGQGFNKISVDISNLSKGIYFLNIENFDGAIIQDKILIE